MNLESELEKKEPEKAICKNEVCETRGNYRRCYLHIYLVCPVWKDYYQSLSEEQKELIFHPERFDMS